MIAEDFGLLKQNPVFQELLHVLEQEKQWHIDRLLRGSTLLGGPATGEMTARYLGVVEGIDKILMYKPAEEGKTDEEAEDHSA